MCHLGVRFLVSSDNLICAVAMCHWILLGMEAKGRFQSCCRAVSQWDACCAGNKKPTELNSKIDADSDGASELLTLLFSHGFLYSTFFLVLL